MKLINKKNNWHCQKQKTSRILLASDFVTWTARYSDGTEPGFSNAEGLSYE